MGSQERFKPCPVLSEKIWNVTHLRSKLLTCVVSKILQDRSCGYSLAVRVDLEDKFSDERLQNLLGLRKHQNSMLAEI